MLKILKQKMTKGMYFSKTPPPLIIHCFTVTNLVLANTNAFTCYPLLALFRIVTPERNKTGRCATISGPSIQDMRTTMEYQTKHVLVQSAARNSR